MPLVTLDDGLTLHYRIDGRADAPALIFSNSLGTDLSMWDAQAAALDDRFQIVRYDTRGHGGSGVPPGPVSLERLGRDLLALFDCLDIVQAHLCGLSLGGLTAQWLAVHNPKRVARLVLSNTAARIGSAETWETRIAAVTAGGMDAIAETVLARFFSPAFRAAQLTTVAVFDAGLRATDPTGYAACCAALRDANLRPASANITAPTLIIAGALDESTSVVQAQELAAAILGSELAILDGAAHLANVERPEAFNILLRRFLLR